MRLVLVPLILAAMLAVGPAAVQANTNQAAAEKIAASLGKKFPGYDIGVTYQNGKVRLVGQVNSPQVIRQAAELVRQVPDVKVTEVDSELLTTSNDVAPAVQPAKPAPLVAQQMPTTPTVPPVPPRAAQRRSVLTPPQSQVAAAPIPIPNPQEQKRVVVQQAALVAARSDAAAGMENMPKMPPQEMAYASEAYGPQGPLPGQYNQPYLPDYAWPSYASYPNYAEVSYPKQYSPKAWPYIGPFYPYPQVPLGWRKVTMEHHDGWWWLDFDDAAPSGPFSPLFRQPVRYTY